SSLEKPSPFERCVRTSSPSRTSTLSPAARSSEATGADSVLFPAPDSPVNHKVKPLSIPERLISEQQLVKPRLQRIRLPCEQALCVEPGQRRGHVHPRSARHLDGVHQTGPRDQAHAIGERRRVERG